MHQIRQRRIDRAGLRAPVRRERGLEHEDVLLPAGWLQFRPVVDSVEQHVLRPSDLAGGPRGVPKPPWLITCRPAGGRTRAPRASHTASFTKLGSQKKTCTGREVGRETLHLASQTSAPNDWGCLSPADITERRR